MSREVVQSVDVDGNGIEIEIKHYTNVGANDIEHTSSFVRIKAISYNYPVPRGNWICISLSQLETLYRSRVFTGQPFTPDCSFYICDEDKEVFASEQDGLKLETSAACIIMKWIVAFRLHNKLREYFNR